MRIPVKSEADAFRLTFVLGAAVVAVVLLGALVSAWAALALGAGLVLGALGWEVATRDPDRPRLRDLGAARADDGCHRVLVVANQTVAGDELRQQIVEHAGHDGLVRVVAP